MLGHGGFGLPNLAAVPTSTAAAAETITVDKWMAPFSVPTRRGGMIAALMPTLALGSFVPNPVPVPTAASWHGQISQPTYRAGLNGALQGPSLAGPSWVPNPVDAPYVSSWVPQLSEPTRRKDATSAGAWIFEPPSLLIAAFHWHRPLAEPTRRKVDLSSYPAITEAPPAITVIATYNWRPPLAEPTRRKIDLATYPAIFEPPEVPASVPVPYVSSWGQGLSEPTRWKGLGPHQQQATFLDPNPFELTHQWQQPLSVPTRRVAVVPDFNPAGQFVYNPVAAELVTVDKYFAWLSEPTRRLGLPTHQQQATFLDPFPVTVAGYQWQPPLSEPTLRKGPFAHQQRADFFDPFPVTVAGYHWFPALSEPTRWKGNPPHQLPPLSLHPFPITVAAFHWFPALSEPTRWKGNPPHQLPPLSFHPFPIIVAGFYQPLSEPVRWKGLRPQYNPATFLDPFPITVAPFYWQQPLSEPTRRVPFNHQHPFLSNQPFPITVAAFYWQQPLSEPVRRKPVTIEFPALAFSNYLVPSTEVVTVDKYINWLAEPVRSRPGLHASQQQASFLVQAAPFGETITPDKWLSALSVPSVMGRISLAAHLQQATAFVDIEFNADTGNFEYIVRARRRGRR